MPEIIVEDGTAASASANSYITVDEVDTYCDDMGYSAWASLATTDKQTAILRAMVFIESLHFKGEKEDYDNPLEWPRFGTYYDDDEIPKPLKRGVCHAAYEESLSPDCLLPTSDDNIKSEKIDVIEVEYFTSRPSDKVFTKILALLSPIIDSGGDRLASVLRT